MRFLTVFLIVMLAACDSDSKGPGELDSRQMEKAAETVTASKANESSDAIAQLCTDFGPQTPRDIASKVGANTVTFPIAPDSTQMNLCNIHTHTNAEHKGPGFNVFVGNETYGGYACNNRAALSAAQLRDPHDGKGPFKKVQPGDTIEVHWVHTSCDVTPGEGLGACLTDTCEDPLLRVEAQVFLLVNDDSAADFTDYTYQGTVRNDLHQARALPVGTGSPIEFRGSTTGPSYTQQVCSPAQVTWSVRPQCMLLDINSLHKWAESGNVFNEQTSHGVRPLVTAEELLAPIQ